MCRFQGSLDLLEFNPNYNPQSGRSLTREEAFVLGWLLFNQQGRNYADIMRECRLSLRQVDAAIQGLIDIEMLVTR
ncbi:MAG: hypothetical protein F6J93_05125 [Oscillatoria sp. SIO1A7]|nr:hypothetical protein [Oscillatoria sp. SIO1A7]